MTNEAKTRAAYRLSYRRDADADAKAPVELPLGICNGGQARDEADKLLALVSDWHSAMVYSAADHTAFYMRAEPAASWV